MSTATHPREGMMAVVRNRRAIITGVRPFDADEEGRLHLVDLDYTDGLGAESDTLLWEREADRQVLEPASLPDVAQTPPMDLLEFDAMVRAARWSALTPSLPFSGLAEDKPPMAAPLYGAVQVEPYQLVPVLRALEMPRVALMLADAVGLGKTVQAGMILRELILRRRIRRILVLCPATLRTQWRDELEEKFSLSFQVVDRPHTLALQRQQGIDANPWRTHERIIASYHYLKQPDVLEQFRTTAAPDGKDGRLRWDLLIVDEAHNLAPAPFGRDSDLSRMLLAIAPWFEHRLFLTATPHNGHTRSFTGLLEALDPIRFTRTHTLDDQGRRRVGEVVLRRLKSEINACYEALGEAPRFSKRTVEALPPLRFSAPERALQEAFTDFRKEIRKVARTASSTERTAAAFALEVLQKRLMSGPWAFGVSWRRLLEGLAAADRDAISVVRAREAADADSEDDTERESRQGLAEQVSGAWLRAWATRLKDEIAAVTAAVDALHLTTPESVKVDARWKALEQLIEQTEGERLVVFTEYLATLDYLFARAQKRFGSEGLLKLYGGMKDDERDAVKRAFNDPKSGARVLFATDAAGEGLNLQRACCLMLHWDIPWNPARMEQRNGRLDRHGQERDVFIMHFDSTDDASMNFLGKVLQKRSQTREDQVATDEIFADALVAHFEYDEDPEATESRIENTLAALRAQKTEPDDVPEGEALPGGADHARLEKLRAELDLSPTTLRETLETTMAIQASRPRLETDKAQRDRFVTPIPPAWSRLIEATLRHPEGGRFAVVFDPAHYIQQRSGRPVFIPEPDSRLLHLGHALYHQVMSTFARYRFPGGPQAATRWVTRRGPVPDGAEALVLLTVEELAVNRLREPCHHWVRTLALPVCEGELQPPVPEVPAAHWAAPPTPGDAHMARDLWDQIDKEIKHFVRNRQGDLTADLKTRLATAGQAVRATEKARFDLRRKELAHALKENTLDRLQKEVDKERKRALQRPLFQEEDDAQQKRIADLEAEIELRRRHYSDAQTQLERERGRILDQVIPPRYTLHGEARVYPIAVEIRLPEVAS